MLLDAGQGEPDAGRQTRRAEERHRRELCAERPDQRRRLRLRLWAMRRTALSLLAFGLLVVAPLAQASDRSLEQALKAYQSRLTADIGYLSSFSTPTRRSAGAVLSRLSRIGSDLSGASRAARGQRASSRSGSRGKSLVLSALSNASVAVSDARAAAYAARSGNHSTASRYTRAEQSAINRAIPQFESGGHLLHLF